MLVKKCCLFKLNYILFTTAIFRYLKFDLSTITITYSIEFLNNFIPNTNEEFVK